jgi:hypothetical protein
MSHAAYTCRVLTAEDSNDAAFAKCQSEGNKQNRALSTPRVVQMLTAERPYWETTTPLIAVYWFADTRLLTQVKQ